MKRSKETAIRARRILIKDKTRIPDGFKALLVGDLSSLFAHYFELSEPFVELKIRVDEDGRYLVSAFLRAERLKDVPICLPTLE